MAPTAANSLKPVQELVEDGVVPEKYIQQFEDDSQVGDSPLPFMDGPTIDFSLLLSSNQEELAKLRNALSSWGCFQVCIYVLFITKSYIGLIIFILMQNI